MSAVTIVYECRTCHARSPRVSGEAGQPMGWAGVEACQAIEHLPIVHGAGVTYERFDFPILDAPSPGLFEAP